MARRSIDTSIFLRALERRRRCAADADAPADRRHFDAKARRRQLWSIGTQIAADSSPYASAAPSTKQTLTHPQTIASSRSSYLFSALNRFTSSDVGNRTGGAPKTLPRPSLSDRNESSSFAIRSERDAPGQYLPDRDTL